METSATLRKKYDLPNVARIPGFRCDITRLQSATRALGDKFVNVYKTDPRYFGQTLKLAESSGDIFQQLNLTEYNLERAGDLSATELALLAQNESELSAAAAYRRKLNPVDPRCDEHNYDKPTDFYRDSYFAEVVGRFRARAIRVRLARLPARSILDPHIDYDPSYATRVLIPIFSNPMAFTVVWRRNQPAFYALPADGHAYFLNTGFKHGVVNFGETDRIALMISLATQEDLAGIEREEARGLEFRLQ